MNFDQILKADPSLFKNIKNIEVGKSLILTPIFTGLFEQEAWWYLHNTRNEEVKKFLPKVYVQTEEDARNMLMDFIGRAFAMQSILYCIRPKEEKVPLGYIHVNSPLTPTGLESWTLDYWLGKDFQGKGIMLVSVYSLLKHLRDFQIPKVFALVHNENTKSSSLLKKLNFALYSQESQGEKRDLYGIILNE